MTIATMHDVDATVAEEVRAMIARRRVTQKRLAEALGLSEMALSRRLSGGVPISVSELVRLAEVLGCRPAELLPHLDSNQKPFDYSSEDLDFMQNAVAYPKSEALSRQLPRRTSTGDRRIAADRVSSDFVLAA